jgi:hypothetical protein
MPIARFEMPDGRIGRFEVPEGTSPEEAQQLIASSLGQMDLGSAATPKKGIGAALGSGTESFIGSLRTGAEAIFSPEEAARKGLEREEARAGKYADQIGLDRLKEVYAKQGLTGAIGEVGRQIPLAIAEQAPNIAATLGSAKLGATAGSVFGPVGTGIGAIGGALVPSALQLFGSNIQRQAAEQQATGQPLDISRSSAAGAAAIQAPLDVAATFIPLGGKMAGKFLGKEVEQLLMRGGTDAAEKLAKESFAKTLTKGVAVGAAAEIPTEITQQMLERYQAGLDLTSPDALKEYGEVAYQAGLLSPIGGAGRFVSKSGARGQIEEKKQEERRIAQEEARVLKEQEAMAEEARALGAAQQETGQLFGEAVPTAEEVSPLPGAPSTLTVAEREEQAAAQQETQVSERGRLLKEADTFDKQLLDIEKQRDAAAAAGDFKQFGALDTQARALEDGIKKTTEALKVLPADLSPEMEMAKLRGEQKSLIKQLQNLTGPSYDPKKAASVTTKLNEIETRLAEVAPTATQLDMFDPAKLQAEDRQLRERETEQRAQEQTDLFAQVQKEGKKEVLDEEAINRYQKGLQELEDAYAAGADERIINRLIDTLQQAGQEKDQAVAKAGAPTGAEQEEGIVRLQRIKRAIDEEAAKFASVTTDEEVNAIRTNIAALQKRYAEAQTARAQAQPENVEAQANQEQKDALLEAVENVRTILSGEYINSRNVDVASSLKSTIEERIRAAGGAYTTAAIKEVNAVRALNKQQPLTNDEALKLATTVKSRFDYLAQDPTYLAEKVRDGNLKILKTALDKAKVSLFKGPSKLQKTTPIIKQERDPLTMLRNEMAKKEPDPKRVAQLRKEIDALKKEDDRIEAEKAKKEQVELPGVNVDQKDLFAAKDLEPIAEVRATPANFQRFVGIQANRFKQAKEVAERAIAEAKERADKAKVRADAKAAETAQELTKQIAEQRDLIQDILKKDIIISDLRGQATRMWQERGRLVKELKTARKENKSIIKNAIQEIDDTVDNRNKQIDALHARANELKNANLEREQALLERLEKAYAKTPEAKSKQAIATARANVGKTEAAIRAQQERQLKEKRAAEQQSLEFKETLPSTTRETVETLKKVKGKGQEALRREKITRREVPLTAQEKRAEAQARAQAGAAERVADKKAIAARLEQGLSGTVANAKEQLVTLEAKLKKVEKDIEASQSKKASPAESVRRKKMAALQKQLKDAVTELKEKGVAAERGAETIGAQPPKTERKKALKTGVRKVDVTKQGMKAVRDLEQEARDVGVSREDYEFVTQGLSFGFKARDEKTQGAGVSQADVKKELGKIKMPKGLDIIVVDKINPQLAELIRARGYNPDTIRGAVMASGKVMIVAGNHTDIKDVKSTIAHELIGHVGVDGLLGETGMRALAKKIQKDENSVFDLATKLGVFDDVLGAYSAARRYMSEEDAVLQAVRELIAHVEEASPNRSFLEKANAFLKAIVGAIRSALRNRGLDLDISTSDIYKLLRDARANFKDMAPGAHINKMGEIVFSGKPAVANAGFEDVLGFSDKIVAKEKSLKDRILGEATGLIFKTKYVDRFAPVQAVANEMKDSLKATQLMYFLRMHDQRMAITSEVASSGPIELKPAKDGKGLIIESTPGANLQDMAVALKDADVGNPEATSRVFTMYLAAKRAKNVGLNKLNFGPEVTQKMLDDTMKAVDNSPATKAAFEKAAGIYNEYNKGLINFAVKTGAIAKDVGAQLLKNNDYVPFYRPTNDGSVFLEIGGAPAIKIGNLKDQPYLHELVGGDKPIFDVFTSALQNTSMLTDMALRNLATRNVAYALGDMGLLEVGEKEKGSGIRKGDGPRGPTIIRFKMDGENYYADVNTDAAGVNAELLVKGLEGVNTSLPNAVKLMNIPANLLRKWVTRNPAYALRQVVRDPLNAVMTTGLNTVPVVSSFQEISKMIRGKSEGEALLKGRGILGGQVLTGTSEDMTKIMRDITAGKKGWDYQMARLDSLAIKGDAATRVVMYNNFLKQGLSEMEATLATLESMNFSKRGISPSLFALSTMVPFMNAQIQGLNVMYQAFTGKMPFSEKLKVKQKLFQRAAMMAGFTMLYASMMQDDESYQNANDDEKYSNWFMPNPFGEEYIKVPIPFEMGLLFKAIPEALVNTMFGDAKARDTMSAIGKMTWNSIPISGPQGIKPALETAINYSFFTGRPIESERLQRYEPGERYTDRTSELVKSIGGALNISPVKIEYLIKGYTGSLPLAIVSLSNPVLRSSEAGEQPETRSFIGSETPLIGSFFQAKDATGLVNKAYKDMEEINKAKETYNKILDEGREQEAEAYMEANADMIAMGSMAGRFRKRMGDLTSQERLVRSDSTLSAGEKRELLDEIRKEKIELAKSFSSARE